MACNTHPDEASMKPRIESTSTAEFPQLVVDYPAPNELPDSELSLVSARAPFGARQRLRIGSAVRGGGAAHERRV